MSDLEGARQTYRRFLAGRLRDPSVSLDEQEQPIFHVKDETGDWVGGWQEFASWLTVERPEVLHIVVSTRAEFVESAEAKET